MSDKYTELDRVLDQESYEYLSENEPMIALSIERLVAKDVSPEDIRRRVVERCGAHRIAFAKRCEGAARWLQGQER